MVMVTGRDCVMASVEEDHDVAGIRCRLVVVRLVASPIVVSSGSSSSSSSTSNSSGAGGGNGGSGGGGGGGGGDGGGSGGGGGGGSDGGNGGGSAGWWIPKMMVGWSDGGAPSAQAVLSDADAVTGAQRDPTQLDLTSHIRSRIKRRGLGKWSACACVVVSSPSRP
ncbi:unnamed protein product [Lasius platythorax]|uniref:Uncharacterized protein n=1 Tax=Lasius platythorax TaxID=488582 RepID=A0AAV2N213_9HYME